MVGGQLGIHERPDVREHDSESHRARVGVYPLSTCQASGMRIGILGATGPAGRGLAARLASAGHDVLFGSRNVAKAQTGVAELRDRWGERVAGLVPSDNADACDAPVVFLAVNADAAIPTVEEHKTRLSDRTVVSIANQLVRKGSEFNAVLPPQGSVAAEIQELLPASKVVTTFHLVPAAEFDELDHAMESDVVVLGDDPDALDTLCEIVRDIPNLRAFDGGSLANAVGMETFAAVLLTINLKNKARASLRLAGL
jgi:8-hydroxy-5-deazaflavin:NADPH oxidoreductase